MFDLTQQIRLTPDLQRKYIQARILLHICFFLALVFVANRVLFPSQSLDLFFDNINSTKNTIVNPRLSDGKIPPKGVVSAKDSFTFNANPFGNFSSVKISLKTDSGNVADDANVTMRKSYQAFFLPVGQPMGFKNGTLVTTTDGNYYIVSNGILRKFANTDIILNFGYPKSSFMEISADDMKYNPQGPDITSSNTYPDDTLFYISGTYYQLKNGQLLSFVSDRAFLSQYKAVQAIVKDKNIFESYPPSEMSVGFADATLGSASESVFILSKGKSFPVADFNTFTAMGFSWDNVIAMESDELGSYEQQKQFTLDQFHPEGTIFLDGKTNNYYMIDEGRKRPILSNKVLETYPAEKAILVDQTGAQQKITCALKKNSLSSNTYSCELPLDSVASVVGNDYELEAKFNNDTKIKQVNLNFSTPIAWSNLRFSLSKIKENLKNNYLQQ